MGSFYRTQKQEWENICQDIFADGEMEEGLQTITKLQCWTHWEVQVAWSGTRTSHKGGPAWGFCKNGSGQL